MKHKKLIITLASVGGAIIILASVLLGLFCPRKIGFYFNVKADKVDSVCVEYYDMDIDGKKEIYLDKDNTKSFLKDLKKIKAKPKYFNCKCAAIYTFSVKCGNSVYMIDSLGVDRYELNERNKLDFQKSRRFDAKENDMEKLLKYFDM